ncbi:MAG TPA: hypothetical protein VKR58_05420 [Aquella sp.]|nr:hypothetical protein [Aquella sp.]
MIHLVKEKAYGFRFLQSIVILDGDVKIPQCNKYKNILLLPGGNSPEKIIAQFLWDTSDDSPIWDKIQPGYSKQIAFKDFKLKDILNNFEESKSRETAKKWFNSQSEYWGRGCARVITPWIKQNQSIIDDFVDNLKLLLNKYKTNI